MADNLDRVAIESNLRQSRDLAQARPLIIDCISRPFSRKG